MGVSIFSYAGHVQFGLISDAALTSYPEALVSRFPEEIREYLYYVLLDLPQPFPVTPTPAGSGFNARRTASPNPSASSASGL